MDSEAALSVSKKYLGSEIALSVSKKYLESPTIKEITLTDMVWDLRWSLDYFLKRLNARDKSSLANQFSAAIMSASDNFTLVWYTTALGLVADQADTRLRKRAIERVVEALEQQEDSAAIVAFSSALKDHLSVMTPGQGRRVAEKIFRSMAREKRPKPLLELGEGLRAYAAWLETEETQAVCRQDLDEIEYTFKRISGAGSETFDEIRTRMENIVKYAERLNEQQRFTLCNELFALIERYRDRDYLYALGGPLKEMAPLFNREQTQAMVERLVQMIEHEKESANRR